MNGVLVIDKPAGLTSHDVVNRVRRILSQQSIGHLGTLDPQATGVLPLVLGSLTRLAQFYTRSEKTYEGVIHFGFATDTYDAEGEPTSAKQDIVLADEAVRTVASRFRGTIQQMPPPFSAKKIAGVPAYKLARQKRDVRLQAVTVEVKEFEIVRIEGTCAEFCARVSSGTYMRSIAHDLGRELGCGAHLASLRRTATAEFALDNAHTLEDIEQAVQQGRAKELFFHPRLLLPQLAATTATPEAVALIRNGRAVNLPDFSRSPQIKVFDGEQELVAIATRVAGTLFHPSIVFSVTK